MKNIETIVSELIPELSKTLPYDLAYKQRKQNLQKAITKLAAEKGQGSILDQYIRGVLEEKIEAPQITKEVAKDYERGSTVKEVEAAVEKCEMRVLEIVSKQAFLSGVDFFNKTKRKRADSKYLRLEAKKAFDKLKPDYLMEYEEFVEDLIQYNIRLKSILNQLKYDDDLTTELLEFESIVSAVQITASKCSFIKGFLNGIHFCKERGFKFNL